MLNNYIIPIWNWSSPRSLVSFTINSITLFLYGIGAISNVTDLFVIL